MLLSYLFVVGSGLVLSGQPADWLELARRGQRHVLIPL
jgi:hypothetical protein